MPSNICTDQLLEVIKKIGDPEAQQDMIDAMAEVLEGNLDPASVRARIRTAMNKIKTRAVVKEGHRQKKVLLDAKMQKIPVKDRLSAIFGSITPHKFWFGGDIVQPLTRAFGPQVTHAYDTVLGIVLKETSTIRVGVQGLDVTTALTTNREFGAAVKAAMLGLKPTLANTEPAVNEVAGVFRKILLQHRDLELDAGIPSGLLDDYFPQHTDIGQITRNRDNWYDFMRKNLDPERHGEVTDDMLDEMYARAVNRGSGDFADHKGVATPNETRTYYFKSKEAEFEYTELFSNQDVWTAVMNKLAKMHRRAAMAHELGPDPIRMLRELAQEAKDQQAKSGFPADPRLERQLRITLDYLSGQFTGKRNAIANIRMAMANTFSFLHLGKAALYFITDTPMQMAKMSGVVKEGSNLNTLMLTARRFSDFKGSGDVAQIIERVRATELMAQAMVVGRYSPDFRNMHQPSIDYTGMSPAWQKFTDLTEKVEFGTRTAVAKYFKFNGINHATESSIDVGIATQAVELKSLVGKTFQEFEQLNPTLFRRYKAYGMDEDMWNKLAKVEHIDEEFFQPSMIDDHDARYFIEGVMTQEAEMVVGMPDLLASAMQGYRRHSAGGVGSVGGEAYNASMQYLVTRYNQFTRLYGQAFNEQGVKGYLKLATAGFAGGLVYTQVRAAISDEPLFEPSSPDFWLRSLDASNSLFLLSAVPREMLARSRGGYSTSSAELFMEQAGPIVATALDAGESILKTVPKMFNEDAHVWEDMVKPDLQKKALSLLTPTNVLYFDGALKKAHRFLLEETGVNPDANANREERFIEEGRAGTQGIFSKALE